MSVSLGKVSDEVLEFLKEFGLSEREINLYFSLLKLGPNTIMNLSRQTGVKRSTTHNNVEELINKGLVSQTNFGERRMVIAEDPEQLKVLIEQKKFRVNRMADNLDSVVGLIKNLIPSSNTKDNFEVKYYTGKDNVSTIYESTIKTDVVYSFANIDNFYEVFPEGLSLIEKVINKKIKRKVYDILIQSDLALKHAESRKSKDLYEYKLIKKPAEDFGFDFQIFGDMVILFQLDKEDISAIQIKSKSIANGLRALHKTIWDLI